MKISIVIPNYNGKGLLEKNLSKIQQIFRGIEIIVVDDASTDKSAEMLQKFFPKIKIIRHTKNMGFASSVNDGVKIAKGELILLLNSDVIPDKNCVDYLVGHFHDANVFAAGCLQVVVEGKNKTIQGRGIGKFEKGFLIHGAGRVDLKNTLWIFGGAGLFRKELWLKLGGIDTLYNPFYWEDIDLSYRALKSGYKLIFEPKSIVFHYGEKGAVRRNYSQYEIKKIAYRGQILFVWLNITDVAYLLEHVFFLPYHLFKAVLSGDWAFLFGFFLALRSLPTIFMHRVRNLKLNKISDKKILEDFKEEF